MQTFTINDIRSWEPCYDPARHLPKNWSGTALDILRHETIPASDKLWVVLRRDVLDRKTLRLFAVWCARQVQHLMTDKRSLHALDVAERYAHGKATDEELTDAVQDAYAAVAYADAARAAAAAAYYAAAADYTATAADYAATPAYAAAAVAAYAAADARDAQVAKLIEMLE